MTARDPRDQLDQIVVHFSQHGGRELPARLTPSPAELGAVLDLAVVRLGDARASGDWMLPHNLERAIAALLARLPVLARSQLETLIGTLHADDGNFEVDISVEWRGVVVAALERWHAAHPDEEARSLAKLVLQQLPTDDSQRRSRDDRKLRERVGELVGHVVVFWPEGATAWSRAMAADLAALSVEAQAPWQALLAQAGGTNAARPSARWQRETATRVAALGDFAARLAAWLPLVEKPKELQKIHWTILAPISDGDTRILTTLVWAAAGVGGEVAGLIGDLGAVCFTKIPDYGAVSTKVGNACLWSLGAMPGLDGVSQLGRLKMRVKYSQAQRLIGRSLDAAATRAGLSVDDLEELAVPSFGLDDAGSTSATLGEWTAVIEVGAVARLRWVHPTKKSPRSPPKDAKADPGWKELKKRVAEIDQRLVIERQRLERLYLARRELAYGEFVERYLRHPLVGTLARRLLWNVVDDGQTKVGVWRGRGLCGLDDALLNPAPAARVSLWHPLGHDPSDVAVWQDFLEHHGVVQPFKQLHREVYTLGADDDVLHSNRFAGHVLRQHQFAALLQTRGWRFRLMGAFDSHNTPSVDLPAWGLGAELHVDYPAEDATTAAGICIHIRTDAVRFVRDGEAVPLDEVPPLLFSETMRDIDLFVGVSTIATDATWRDRGGPFARYWAEMAYGALSTIAESRRALLRQLLPRLGAVSERITIEERHLLVRGPARTYRLHIGSGQVLVAPNDLPLVLPDLPEPSLSLPFEGDAGLRTLLARAVHLVTEG